MEPTDALRSIEVVLRLAVVAVLGSEGWMTARGAPDRATLEQRRDEEAARRDGAVTSNSLIDYTETYHLAELIEKNWDKFKPVFDDQRRTLAYLSVIKDVRNTIAHARDLVPFERDLLSGIAGQFRNQVSIYRSNAVDPSAQYYPRIESITDGFGNPGGYEREQVMGRLEVGQVLTFTGRAFDANNRGVTWYIVDASADYPPSMRHVDKSLWVRCAEGADVTFEYVVTEDKIGEWLSVAIFIASAAKYHRVRYGYDDLKVFQYAVNPPHGD